MPNVDPNSIPNDWLVEQLPDTTLESIIRLELERAKPINTDTDNLIQMALANKSEDWNQFTSIMTDKDELWYISNSSEEWTSLAGRSGYAIVRNGKIIAAKITMMS